jgi:DNA-binding NarL/FixJ family response regulator
LDVSGNTIPAYMSVIRSKLGVTTDIQAVLRYLAYQQANQPK